MIPEPSVIISTPFRRLYDEVDRNMAMLGVNSFTDLHAGLLHRKA